MLKKALFKDNLGCEPETYKRNLLRYLNELDKLIDERVFKYGELWMKEREVKEIKEIEKRLKEREIQQQESLSTDSTTLDTTLVTEGISLDAKNENRSSNNESSNSGYDATDAEKILVDTVTSDIEYVDIGPSYDNDTMFEVHHETSKNVFAHGIQNHEQHELVPDTYMVNGNNGNIISDIPNLDSDRGKKEHDDVDNEKERALSASLVNNLKCEVENCTKVNREAQQTNALLTKELERYKKKEKHFAKVTSIESEY
ncbi:hypothetical protein Tco_1497174 [Tanacetum coccineum]